MAEHLVALARRRVRVGAVAVGLLLTGISACSPFDPVKLKRHLLLTPDHYDELGIPQAEWHAYDDQHSRNSPCTNAAGGGHKYLDCSTLVHPRFTWDGTTCPQPEKMTADNLPKVESDGAGVRLVGVISKLLACNAGTSPERCYNVDKDGDVSNMWGAGVGLRFSAWSPNSNGVVGVAFDLKTLTNDLPLRVELPIVLDEDTAVPNRPLMRDDGSVLGTDGMVYSCDQSTPHQVKSTGMLKDVRVPPDSNAILTSEQHPFGHPFWQSASQPNEALTWDQPSPVKPGHNEFLWKDVKEPPEPDGNYVFDPEEEFKLLGIEFHVFHPPRNTDSITFDFSIENLAFIVED